MTKVKQNFIFFSFLIFWISFVSLVAAKKYVSPQQYLEDCFQLSKKVYDSKFRPTFLIALWRGGAPVGIVVDEYFRYMGASIEQHIALRTIAYHGDELQSAVKIFNFDYVLENISSDDKLLIVDDVVDSGKTIQEVLKQITEKCGANRPKDIRVAAVYYKPKKSSIRPDYYLHATDLWLVFPHEIEGLTIDEVRDCKSLEIAKTLR